MLLLLLSHTKGAIAAPAVAAVAVKIIAGVCIPQETSWEASDLFYNGIQFQSAVALSCLLIRLSVKVQKDFQSLVSDMILVLVQLILSVFAIDGRIHQDIVILNGDNVAIHFEEQCFVKREGMMQNAKDGGGRTPSKIILCSKVAIYSS
jgi:hypothetical protein